MSSRDKHTAIIDRVEQVRARTRLGKSRFCAAFDMKPQTYNNFTGHQHSKPNADLLVGVCRAYNVNPEWLLLGEGPMFRDQAADPTVETRLASLERRVALLQVGEQPLQEAEPASAEKSAEVQNPRGEQPEGRS